MRDGAPGFAVGCFSHGLLGLLSENKYTVPPFSTETTTTSTGMPTLGTATQIIPRCNNVHARMLGNSGSATAGRVAPRIGDVGSAAALPLEPPLETRPPSPAGADTAVALPLDVNDLRGPDAALELDTSKAQQRQHGDDNSKTQLMYSNDIMVMTIARAVPSKQKPSNATTLGHPRQPGTSQEQNAQLQ